MTPVAVLIVHPAEETRRAVRALVSSAPGFDGRGEAASAEEAIELAVALRPGLALVSASMPGIDGLETSRRLVALLPRLVVVLLYGSAEPSRTELAVASAAAAVQVDALTPASLNALWEEHSGA